jgi:ribosome-associated protein
MDYSKIINAILDKEVYFHFAKSGGKWGQNVNKRETKAELYFNIHDTRYLNDTQKRRLIQCAGHMIHHNEWILIMTDQEERLQVANKEKVIHHFRELMNHVLPEPKQRHGTKAPARVENQRQEAKKYRSALKKWRSGIIRTDD